MYLEEGGTMKRNLSQKSEARLSSYLTSASALGAAAAASSFSTEANAAIVANTTSIPFGINEEVNIDFDGNGSIEFQLDHDRVNIDGTDYDFLQIDKNDTTSAADPLSGPDDAFATFPGEFFPVRADYTGDGVGSWDQADLQAWQNEYGSINEDPENPTFFADGNDDAAINGTDYLIWQQEAGVPFSYDQGYLTDSSESYPTALTAGTSIGPTDFFTFQEGSNFSGTGLAIHANRLIDEDAGTIDTANGVPAFPNSDTSEWVGLGGETRYLGLRFDLDDEGYAGNEFSGSNNGEGLPDEPSNYWYGWVGVQITNEADATGVVTGWAYEDQIGTAIMAGDTGVPPLGAVPEPTSIVTLALGGITLASGFAWRKLFRESSV